MTFHHFIIYTVFCSLFVCVLIVCSPDDPIFYLHHSFIDYLWALWHDANDYDLDGVPAPYSTAYSGDVSRCLSFEFIDYPAVPVRSQKPVH